MRSKLPMVGMLFGLLTLTGGDGVSGTGHVLYEVTTALDMPHLEDNLRYAITREQRCLAMGELHHLFPVMQHPALAGCHLGPESPDGEGQRAELVCEGNHGTTGTALWQTGSPAQTGVLRIRLGGKNMTFSQTVTARELGPC